MTTKMTKKTKPKPIYGPGYAKKVTTINKRTGWPNEPYRHSLASRGIKSGQKSTLNKEYVDKLSDSTKDYKKPQIDPKSIESELYAFDTYKASDGYIYEYNQGNYRARKQGSSTEWLYDPQQQQWYTVEATPGTRTHYGVVRGAKPIQKIEDKYRSRSYSGGYFRFPGYNKEQTINKIKDLKMETYGKYMNGKISKENLDKETADLDIYLAGIYNEK